VDGSGPSASARRLSGLSSLLGELGARCEFPRGGAVTCAVSGGADSLALLILARHLDLEVTAIHVDHGLRPGSHTEADLVSDVSARVGAEFRAIKVVVGDGPNLEARARKARYQVLPVDVLTGHTADDQAETVLLHLMRGGGLDASAAMRPDGRPLIALRRADTVAVCEHFGVAPFQDPSNSDPRFRRNRVRREVIPLLNEVGERDVVPLLSRAAALARVDVDLLNELAAQIEVSDAKALREAPLALARRAIRLWLGGEHPPNAATVARVIEVAAGSSRSTEVGAGRSVRRSRGRLFLDTPDQGRSKGTR